ncbi:MAG: zinc-binding protein [Ruminococcaceae bacterium]|nr:zinc-binding protein [Oscillospiraceae bacterium]
MYNDKTLVCKDCGQEFVFSASEQEFYAEKGFENEPQRCRSCRMARKQARGTATGGARQLFDAVCAECGKACKVPFEPRNDRPVYCSDCFSRR